MEGICISRGWSDIVKCDNHNPIETQPSHSHQSLTLILGLGNTILSDDGVGIYVAREIGEHLQDSHVVVKEASAGGLELLDLMRGFDRVVLIDAMMTGRHEIGSVVRLEIDDLKGGSTMARHQIGFAEALELGRRLGMDLPEKIAIYGIEVKDILTLSESCTSELNDRISEIADEIVRIEFNSTNN